MATLLPNGVNQFIDGNGVPLAGGLVYFYVPSTTVPKDTWQDSGQSTLNTNPIVLDASGEAIIYGSGIYRQQVYDSAGNLIWDQLTASTDTGAVAWGGTSSGSVNAQTIAASTFSSQDGQVVAFLAGLTNTSAMTITLGTGSPISVLKDTLLGPVPLTGSEVTTGNAVMMIYDAGRGAFHLVEYPIISGTGALTNIAGATSIDLGTVTSRNANVTGSAWSATSFGSSASLGAPIYTLTFAGAGTLVHNGTSLILPGGLPIFTAAGDTATAMYLGSSNWRVLQYTQATASPIPAYPPGLLYGMSIANGSDATNDINFAAGNCRDSANAVNIVLGSTITKQIDAVWAVGTNAGGLFSGSLVDGTYHCFVIMRPDTGVVDAGFSSSVTASDRPIAYTYYRRVASIIRASSTIIPFTQTGDRFQRTNSILDVNASNPGTSAVTRTLSVPLGIIVTAMINNQLANGAAGVGTSAYLSPLTAADVAPGSTAPLAESPIASNASGGVSGASWYREIQTDTSGQIRSRLSASDASVTLRIATLGWIDSRGRL